jgi:HK97 family phage portal protein
MLSRLRKMFGAEERKSLASPTAEELALFTGIPVGSLAVSAQTALRVPAVAAAIRILSEAAATLDVGVVRIEGGKEIPDPDHHVAQLLRGDVNDWLSGFEFIRDLVAAALTQDKGGLAWVNWIDGKPEEIIMYRPGIIDADMTADTGEPRYRMNGGDVPSRSILHLRGPFDKSPLTLAREAIGLAKTMESRAGKLFDNSARPSGVIEFPEHLDEESFNRMKKAWKEVHESPDSTGKTAILWDKATFKMFEFKSTDAQFLELRRFQIEEIARAFNIPAHMIGDLTKANYNSLESKNREFIVYALEPWLRALEASLRRALFLPEDRKKFAVRFDRDDLSRASLTERATAINSLRSSEVLSADEGRAWLGMEPRPADSLDQYRNPNINPDRPSEPA